MSNEDENIEEDDSSIRGNIFGRNRFKQAVQEGVPTRGRTWEHNIVIELPGLKNFARGIGNIASSSAAWNLLFPTRMIQQIIHWKNAKICSYREKYKRTDRTVIRDKDSIEMKAFMGV